MKSEQATPVDSIKDAVQSSMKGPELDQHLKKAGGHISQNAVEITIKMKTIVRKPLMIKIIKLHLRNLDNSYIFLIYNEVRMTYAKKTWKNNVIKRINMAFIKFNAIFSIALK